MSLLFKLQFLQLQHDQKFHADIYNLRPQDKVKHFALHVIKYACKLAATGPQNEEDLKRIFTDSLVICFSLANTFNMRLDQEVPILREQAYTHRSRLRPYAKKLLAEYEQQHGLSADSKELGSKILNDAIELMSGVSKATEAWDHLEDYPYIKNLKAFIPRYFAHILIASEYYGITFIECNYLKRILSVEKKNEFVDYFQAEMRSWQDEAIFTLAQEAGLHSDMERIRHEVKNYLLERERWLNTKISPLHPMPKPL